MAHLNISVGGASASADANLQYGSGSVAHILEESRGTVQVGLETGEPEVVIRTAAMPKPAIWTNLTHLAGILFCLCVFCPLLCWFTCLGAALGTACGCAACHAKPVQTVVVGGDHYGLFNQECDKIRWAKVSIEVDCQAAQAEMGRKANATWSDVSVFGCRTDTEQYICKDKDPNAAASPPAKTPAEDAASGATGATGAEPGQQPDDHPESVDGTAPPAAGGDERKPGRGRGSASVTVNIGAKDRKGEMGCGVSVAADDSGSSS